MLPASDTGDSSKQPTPQAALPTPQCHASEPAVPLGQIPEAASTPAPAMVAEATCVAFEAEVLDTAAATGKTSAYMHHAPHIATHAPHIATH